MNNHLLLPLLFLSTTSLTSADKGDLSIALGFNDQRWHALPLLFDITAQDSFVLDTAYFADKAGRNNTFDPNSSINFIKGSSEFTLKYEAKYSNGESTVHGFVGKDMVFVKPPYWFLGDFGIVSEFEGNNPVLQSNGAWTGGRIGLARKQKNKYGLVSQIFQTYEDLNVCMYYYRRDDGYWFALDLPKPMYQKKDLRGILNAKDNAEGLWELNVNKFSFQSYQRERDTTAIFTTTFDGIKLPKAHFTYIVKNTEAKQREDGRYEVRCPTEASPLPSIKLGFEDLTVEIKDVSYAQKVGDVCILKLEAIDEDLFILGSPFYIDTGVCLNYNNGTVAFFDHFM
ncbi:unnamed protein product [Bursaphelenchus xylophilus]|uniref:(pine wood nematode) hypothetical protein n=1 Tax=Bursaphelenchus xylophilus TaxID=6326 RepID=A0A1I7SL62_BURXY|nr:unnamed protein product [Bursaphelenchus xylophilus]CAG9129381.1 unnamed protein product [Bursaphelenchus xylophilus]